MKEHVSFLIIKETVDRIQALFLQALKKLAGGKENGLGLLGDKTSFNFLGCVAGGFYLFIYLFISEGFKDPKLSHASGRGESKGPPQLVLLLLCSGKGGHPSGFGDSLGTQGTGEALL